MQITDNLMKDIANLAKLQLDDNKLVNLKSEMSSILELIQKISVTQTDSISPLAHPLEATQPLREDISHPVNDIAEVQALVDNIEDGLYIVPKVID